MLRILCHPFRALSVRALCFCLLMVSALAVADAQAMPMSHVSRANMAQPLSFDAGFGIYEICADHRTDPQACLFRCLCVFLLSSMPMLGEQRSDPARYGTGLLIQAQPRFVFDVARPPQV